eukprot:PhM_4_TR9507/c0_g1_i1/m.41873
MFAKLNAPAVPLISGRHGRSVALLRAFPLASKMSMTEALQSVFGRPPTVILLFATENITTFCVGLNASGIDPVRRLLATEKERTSSGCMFATTLFGTVPVNAFPSRRIERRELILTVPKHSGKVPLKAFELRSSISNVAFSRPANAQILSPGTGPVSWFMAKFSTARFDSREMLGSVPVIIRDGSVTSLIACMSENVLGSVPPRIIVPTRDSVCSLVDPNNSVGRVPVMPGFIGSWMDVMLLSDDLRDAMASLSHTRLFIPSVMPTTKSYPSMVSHDNPKTTEQGVVALSVSQPSRVPQFGPSQVL